MLMSVIMLFTWQVTNDSRYQQPFTKCVEATYANSDLKRYTESATERLKDRAPVAMAIVPAMYSLGIRKQINITSSKMTLVPNTVTSYHMDEKAQNGSITITWGF